MVQLVLVCLLLGAFIQPQRGGVGSPSNSTNASSPSGSGGVSTGVLTVSSVVTVFTAGGVVYRFNCCWYRSCCFYQCEYFFLSPIDDFVRFAL